MRGPSMNWPRPSPYGPPSSSGPSFSGSTLEIMLMTSMRKPSTPRASHQRSIAYSSWRTAGFSQFRSGCLRENRCRKYSPVRSSYSQADGENSAYQFVGSAPGCPGVAPSRGGRHQYQSRFGLSSLDRDSTNHGCSSEVWLMTTSIISFMSRRCSSAISSSRSASVPNTGSTSQ